VPGNKRLLTLSAGAKRVCLVGRYKAEHHLHAQQQGMKIPNDSRLVQQGDVVGQHDASRKLKAVYQSKGHSGKRITNCSIYGYLKDLNDKNK